MIAKHSRIVDRVLTRLKLRQLRLLVAVGSHGSIKNAACELALVKSSGYGREGGSEGLGNYMTIKNVWHSANIV